MGKLQDRVAIITGAGDGIGRGMARRFASEGARVVVAELDETSGPAVVDELAATSAPRRSSCAPTSG